MQISMSNTSLYIGRRMLRNLSHILAKGEANALERKIDPQVFINDRLAPDMFPLSKQVQIACDMIKNGVCRLAGQEIPKFEDNEQSFADLQARIQKTLAVIDGIAPQSVDGSEDREISFPAGPGRTLTMSGHDYLTTWVLPNLFFHVTTAYDILRHNGVPLGKTDYLLGSQ